MYAVYEKKDLPKVGAVMKNRYKIKISCILLIVLFTLSACGSVGAQKAEATPSPTPVPIERTESITLPESVLDRLQLNVTALSRRLSLYNVTENPDGSCTVHMSQEEKDAILPALRSALDSEMETLAASGTWPFLAKVEISEDADKATLHTTAEQYDPVRDRTCAESVYLPALLYAAFTTENAEAFTMKFTVLDEKGKKLDTFTYPAPAATAEPSASPDTAVSETE